MKVAYEWNIETVDAYDDIVDNDFADKLATLNPEDLDSMHRLCCVRDEYTDTEGVQDRQWCYPTDDGLPEFFQDAYQQNGAKVPQKIRREFERWLK